MLDKGFPCKRREKYGIVTGKTDWLTALGITLIYNRWTDEHMQGGEEKEWKEVRNGV